MCVLYSMYAFIFTQFYLVSRVSFHFHCWTDDKLKITCFLAFTYTISSTVLCVSSMLFNHFYSIEMLSDMFGHNRTAKTFFHHSGVVCVSKFHLQSSPTPPPRMKRKLFSFLCSVLLTVFFSSFLIHFCSAFKMWPTTTHNVLFFFFIFVFSLHRTVSDQ